MAGEVNFGLITDAERRVKNERPVVDGWMTDEAEGSK